MAKRRAIRRLPVLISIVVAMTLAIAPLPEAAEPFKPDWVLLTLIYWSMILPRNFSVGSAWITGLVLDVAQGTLLGQHALALSAIVFLTVRFHLQLRLFPLSQMTLTVAALISLYQFILFWINGVAGVGASGISFWGPLFSGTLLWPLVYLLFGTVSYRRRSA
ncbi:MAG: rod shape-determining protein MreD [Halioglobus sp.]|nr:rod shape-determining protein MreD [Halioglobus sp.]